VHLIFFLLFSTVAVASAAVDPLAPSFTGDLDELEALLGGEVVGFVNRSAGEGIFNQTRSSAQADPPFYHLVRNDSMFRDFENLTGPVDPIPFSVNATWNESFFEMLIRDWW